MEYPVDAITAKDRTEYLYIAQEALRLLNNKFVEWHEDGLYLEDYENLPVNIKKKYGWVNSIDITMLRRFINEDFMPRSRTLCNEIGVERSKLSEEDKEEILGTLDIDGKEGIVGTKADLIKSKRWTVDAAKIEKVVNVAIG